MCSLARCRWSLLAYALVLLLHVSATACTNLLVDDEATADGSTYVTYSCDGGIFAAVRIAPEATYAEGATATIFADSPFYGGDAVNREVLGTIPQTSRTHRYLDILAGPTYVHVGGMNEHGVSIAETTIGGSRSELTNGHGLLAPFSACPERSLMTLALQRAHTAREAVELIGTMAEEYGYSSPFPVDGEQLAIGDSTEVWSMEIFGPGSDWRPDSEEPGAVWCAQRVPDGHVAVSANRSRIGEIDLSDPAMFLASPNVTSLAREQGWWDSERDGPFNWSAAYAPYAAPGTLMREWRVFDIVAPSLGLSPDDPLPFSVAPDRPLSTRDVIAIQRDLLEGTPFDVTANPVFAANGETSSLACPMCSWSFYDLLDLEPQRTISSRHASFTVLYQTRDDAPSELRGCAWFSFGPAATGCYVPIYSGTTALPDAWGSTDLAEGDLALPFWSMLLPGFLATVQWQDAFRDLAALRSPAESRFLAEQQVLSEMLEAWHEQGIEPADRLNEYAADRLTAVLVGFQDLADALLADYVIGLGAYVAAPGPSIELPPLP